MATAVNACFQKLALWMDVNLASFLLAILSKVSQRLKADGDQEDKELNNCYTPPLPFTPWCELTLRKPP